MRSPRLPRLRSACQAAARSTRLPGVSLAKHRLCLHLREPARPRVALRAGRRIKSLVPCNAPACGRHSRVKRPEGAAAFAGPPNPVGFPPQTRNSRHEAVRHFVDARMPTACLTCVCCTTDGPLAHGRHALARGLSETRRAIRRGSLGATRRGSLGATLHALSPGPLRSGRAEHNCLHPGECHRHERCPDVVRRPCAQSAITHRPALHRPRRPMES